MRALKTSLIAIALLAGTTPLRAAQCNWITSPTAMSFGNYSVFSPTALSTATQFSFRCTPNTYARVMLSRGSSNAYVPSRTMKNGALAIAYNIYLDPAGTQIWGDASGGSVAYDVYNSTPQNKDFTDSMFGVSPGGQDLSAGTYTDTVFVTLSYSTNQGGPYTSLAAITLTVSVTVLAECRVDSFTLDFGTYNPFSATALTRSTLLKVYCTKNAAPTSVALNNGSFALGAQKRMMSSTGDFLSYNAALGSTSGTSTSSLVPINSGFALDGNAPALQNVSSGSYTDTLVATVNY